MEKILWQKKQQKKKIINEGEMKKRKKLPGKMISEYMISMKIHIDVDKYFSINKENYINPVRRIKTRNNYD